MSIDPDGVGRLLDTSGEIHLRSSRSHRSNLYHVCDIVNVESSGSVSIRGVCGLNPVVGPVECCSRVDDGY